MIPKGRKINALLYDTGISLLWIKTVPFNAVTSHSVKSGKTWRKGDRAAKSVLNGNQIFQWLRVVRI